MFDPNLIQNNFLPIRREYVCGLLDANCRWIIFCEEKDGMAFLVLVSSKISKQICALPVIKCTKISKGKVLSVIFM